MGWTFFFMFVVLKIPVCAALYLVWWASRSPEPETDGNGADGRGPHRPLHPRPRRPGPVRRGPHAGLPPTSPRRVRVRARGKRLSPSHS